jgi:hypothetical protein
MFVFNFQMFKLSFVPVPSNMHHPVTLGYRGRQWLVRGWMANGSGECGRQRKISKHEMSHVASPRSRLGSPPPVGTPHNNFGTTQNLFGDSRHGSDHNMYLGRAVMAMHSRRMSSRESHPWFATRCPVRTLERCIYESSKGSIPLDTYVPFFGPLYAGPPPF